jgi:hypothetical protein
MIDDDFEVELQDLAIDEIRELLLEAGADVSVEQAGQLAHFVAETGSLEAALQVLGRLARHREAA